MGPLSSEGKRIRGRKGQQIRKRRLSRSNSMCEHCLPKGIMRPATVVNHKIPLAHGGEDVDDNTENLCGECDAIETAKWFSRRQAIGVDGWPIS